MKKLKLLFLAISAMTFMHQGNAFAGVATTDQYQFEFNGLWTSTIPSGPAITATTSTTAGNSMFGIGSGGIGFNTGSTAAQFSTSAASGARGGVIQNLNGGVALSTTQKEVVEFDWLAATPNGDAGAYTAIGLSDAAKQPVFALAVENWGGAHAGVHLMNLKPAKLTAAFLFTAPAYVTTGNYKADWVAAEDSSAIGSTFPSGKSYHIKAKLDYATHLIDSIWITRNDSAAAQYIGTNISFLSATATNVDRLSFATPRGKNNTNSGNGSVISAVNTIDNFSVYLHIDGNIILPYNNFNFSYNKGNGPSSEVAIRIKGFNLQSNVTITTSANIQISNKSGSEFAINPLTYSPTGSSLDTVFYARLKAGLIPDTYTDSITISTFNGTTQKITCIGTVIGALLSSSTKQLDGYSYSENYGPSTSKSFVVSGTLLESNVIITSTSNIEISTNGSNYSSSITLTPSVGILNQTTIFSRLKAGLTNGVYTDSILIQSLGAKQCKIACTSLIVKPSTTISTSTLNAFNYTYNNGPSNQQSFTVSGEYLSSNITITPDPNFQISSVSGGAFSSSPISLVLSGDKVASTIIYVRLKAELQGGNYNGAIIISSSYVTSKQIYCSGTVDNGVGLTYNVAVPTNTNSCFIAGTMTNGSLISMTKIDASHYSITIPNANINDSYNYYCGPDYNYIELSQSNSNVSARSYWTKDSVSIWSLIYNPNIQYSIRVTTGFNGTSRNGNEVILDGSYISCIEGSSPTFTFTPALGYEVATLTYDGTDVKANLANNQYTIPAITADGTLAVTFAKTDYLITIKSAESGVVRLFCHYGDTPKFQIEATPFTTNWRLHSVYLDAAEITSELSNGIYQFAPVTKSMSLNITFDIVDNVSNTPSNSRVKVYPSQSNIVVEGTRQGEIVRFYTLEGIEIKQVKSLGEKIMIPSIEGNVYIVKTASRAVKVML